MKLSKIRQKIYKTPYEKELERWWGDGGDKKLRFNYDLTEDSIVLDLGGFEGQWASDLYSRYNPSIHIFEPVPEYCEEIKKRFMNNKKISVYCFGLGADDSLEKIGVMGHESSIFRSNGKTGTIEIKSIETWLQENHIDDIDLMKINIEGGEYDLLEKIISTGTIRRIKRLQIQFHDFFPDAESRMQQIKNSLASTHAPTYQYKFVWENWQIKAAPTSP